MSLYRPPSYGTGGLFRVGASVVPDPAYAAPERLTHPERMRIRAAAFQAPRRYPGPVGEVLAKELRDWEDFGYRFGGRALIIRLVDEIMKPRE